MKSRSDIYKEAAVKLGISEELVKKVYSGYWDIIRELLQELPMKKNLTKEDFANMKTSVSIPYLGRLGCTHDYYMKLKEKRYKINQYYENQKHNSAVESHSNNS